MQTITRNALALSVRMAVTTAVGLMTWRIALQLLGVYSMGLYALIVGVIALGDVLHATLAGAYDRFMAYSLAKKSADIGDVIRTARHLQKRVVAAVIVLAESFGLWYVLSLDDISVANTAVVVMVFQLALASSVLTILTAPARSALTAFERMDLLARTDIVAGILRFVILAILLWAFIRFEQIGSDVALLSYAVVCVAFPLWIYLTMWRHTRRLVGTKGSVSASTLKDIKRYAAADFFGNAAVAIRDQGIILAINAIAGLPATAALALATAVVVKVQTWAQSILTAFVPPIVKAFASNDLHRMWHNARLAFLWSVGAFLLCAVPTGIFADSLTSLWLGKDMPALTPDLLIISLIAGAFVSLTNVFASIVHASGRIRTYSIVSGVIYLLSPLSVYVSARYCGTNTTFAFASVIPIYAAVTLTAIICARHTTKRRSSSSNESGKDRTRILLIIRSLNIGGAERAIIDSLYRHHNRSSQQIDVWTLCGGKWQDQLPEYVNILPPAWRKGERSRTLSLQLRMARYGFATPLRRHLKKCAADFGKYDIVVCWLEGLSAVAHDAIIQRVERSGLTRHYSMIHSDFSHLRDHALPWDTPCRERRYYRGMDAVIAVAPHVAEAFRAFMAVDTPPIYIRQNEIDAERIRSLSQQALPTVPPRRPGVRRLVAVGRLEKVKCFERLIDVARAERAKGAVEIRLIGDGSQRERLARAYAEASVDDIITIVGALDNPYGEIAAADALVVTSATEGDPLIIHEANALNCPVVWL